MRKGGARSDVTLRSLEIFQICGREGSFQEATKKTGLSISTISHHVRVLEEQLGVELFNHSRRPMVLTPSGKSFLRNIEPGLLAIRKAKAEVSIGTAAESAYLRIGAIEDFDSDITPELAVFLNKKMPKCEFTYRTDTSLQILEMLRNRELDLGITVSPSERLQDLQDNPFLKDPYVVVLPAEDIASAEDLLSGKVDFPFLRFSSNLIISRQIEAQLRRLGLSLPFRCESDNNQTLLAMVAHGAGWTITTPMLFSRARRFHTNLRLHKFPGRSFSRTVSIVTTADCPRSTRRIVEEEMRRSIYQHAIEPVCKLAPWLEGQFTLLN
ncbi:MAG: LysR family transcriptional regulator [Paracoccaceae bacterium]